MAEAAEVFHDVQMDMEDRPVMVQSQMKNQKLCTRLVIADKSLVYPASQLLRALAPDVLLVTFALGTPVDEVVAAAGSSVFTTAAIWTRHAKKLEVEPMEDDAPTEEGEAKTPRRSLRRTSSTAGEATPEAFAAKQQEVWATTLSLVQALGKAGTVAKDGRIHVLTPNILDVGAPDSASERDAHERQLLRTLEEAARGPSVVVAVGLSLQESVGSLACHSLSREVVDPVGAYFEKARLRDWVFAHNQYRRNSKLGFDPNAASVAGIEDATDVKQSVMTWLQEIPWQYSIMVSSFLVLFVPDVCSSYRSNCGNHEKLGTHTAAGQYVFAMNCITCAVFFTSNIFYNRREMWLIEWLDADDELPPTNLTNVIERYPKIKAKLAVQNRRCLVASLVTIFFLLVNFISSCTLLLHRALHAQVCCLGTIPQAVKTVTTLVTSVLLVIVKLLRHLRTARRSLINNMGVSSVHMLPLSYNCIDHDHLNDDQEDGDA